MTLTFTGPMTRKSFPVLLPPELEHLRAGWEYCTRCPLHADRRRTVHYRGDVTCDILFIGEAPGELEDSDGLPFNPEAPAGGLLEEMITEARTTAAGEPPNPSNDWSPTTTQILTTPAAKKIARVTFGFANLCACIPYDHDAPRSNTIRPPSKEEAKECRPRLWSIIETCQPQVIMICGTTTTLPLMRPLFSKIRKLKTRSGLTEPPNVVPVKHPSAIVRLTGQTHVVQRQKFVMALTQQLEQLT